MSGSLHGTLETILVVDNDKAVRTTVVNILERANYHVLSADSADGALRLTEETDGTIDMLLCAVDMPQMSGPDLGERLKKTRRGMHVMLMAGGSTGNLLVLNYGWAYIQKALVPVKLVEMVTYVLSSRNRSQLGGQEFDSRKDFPYKTS